MAKMRYSALIVVFAVLLFAVTKPINAQDTFSIVAVDTLTGEIGSAGASCVGPIGGVGAFILSDVIEGLGAIHTQASYLAANQQNAHARMLEGLSPQEIINWLVANDAQGNPTIRQYGIVDLTRNGESAAYTGVNCLDYKNHITGPGYSVQGNILLGQVIIDTMQHVFLNTPGPLADRLMQTLEAAKIIGADTRCASRGTSSQSSFIKVVRIGDGNTPYLQEIVPDSPVNVDPIDLLHIKFDQWKADLFSTVDPFLSRAEFDLDSLPADSSSQAVLTITPKNNSDTLLVSGLDILLTHTGAGIFSPITDLGNGTYIATVTAPATPGVDTVSIQTVNGQDTVALAVRPVIHYLLATGIGGNPGVRSHISDRFILSQNYPNPFNPNTLIAYKLLKAGEVRLTIYNQLGQNIRTLADDSQEAGEYRIQWDGTDDNNSLVSSGVYFYQLQVDSHTSTRKMIKLH